MDNIMMVSGTFSVEIKYIEPPLECGDPNGIWVEEKQNPKISAFVNGPEQSFDSNQMLMTAEE
jgi:hypothetical protein